jgi:hypothetical protein
MGPRTPNFYNYVVSPSAEKLPVNFFGSAQAMTKTNGNFVKFGFRDGTTLQIPAGYNDTDRDYIYEQFEQQYRFRRVFDVAFFGVLPCVVLFVLGYVLLWVGRGFAG